jgi:hypothetical protein
MLLGHVCVPRSPAKACRIDRQRATAKTLLPLRQIRSRAISFSCLRSKITFPSSQAIKDSLSMNAAGVDLS